MCFPTHIEIPCLSFKGENIAEGEGTQYASSTPVHVAANEGVDSLTLFRR